MSILDAVIIYFACGSPFGVYQITRNEESRPFRRWAGVAASFLFWPGYVSRLAIDRFYATDRPSHEEIERIRAAIEQAGLQELPTASLFEFREIYYRYAGLAEASAGNSGSPALELLEIAGTGNTAAASACLSRRDRMKIDFHLTIARNEFLDLITELGSVPNGSGIVKHALELSEHLRDPLAINELRSLVICAHDPVPEPEAEVWKAKSRSLSNMS